MKKLSRQRGLQLEAFGSILIVTVMLADRFLYEIQSGFLLACAFVSAAALIAGIRTVKRADEEAAAAAKAAPSGMEKYEKSHR